MFSVCWWTRGVLLLDGSLRRGSSSSSSSSSTTQQRLQRQPQRRWFSSFPGASRFRWNFEKQPSTTVTHLNNTDKDPVDWRRVHSREGGALPSSCSSCSSIYGPNVIQVSSLPMGKTPEYLQERLRRFFSKFGMVIGCRVTPHDRDPYQTNGIGYVAFRSRRSVQCAIKSPAVPFPISLHNKTIRMQDLLTNQRNDCQFRFRQTHYHLQILSIAIQLYTKLQTQGPIPIQKVSTGIYERPYINSHKQFTLHNNNYTLQQLQQPEPSTNTLRVVTTKRRRRQDGSHCHHRLIVSHKRNPRLYMGNWIGRKGGLQRSRETWYHLYQKEMIYGFYYDEGKVFDLNQKLPKTNSPPILSGLTNPISRALNMNLEPLDDSTLRALLVNINNVFILNSPIHHADESVYQIYGSWAAMLQSYPFNKLFGILNGSSDHTNDSTSFVFSHLLSKSEVNRFLYLAYIQLSKDLKRQLSIHWRQGRPPLPPEIITHQQLPPLSEQLQLQSRSTKILRRYDERLIFKLKLKAENKAIQMQNKLKKLQKPKEHETDTDDEQETDTRTTTTTTTL